MVPLFSVVFVLLFFLSCGGTEREKKEVEPEVVKNLWQKTEVTKLTDGGLLSTNVKALPDKQMENLIHFFYLVDAHEATDDNPTPPIEYILRHSIWDINASEEGKIITSNDIVTLDNTLEFDVTNDINNNLFVVYRGGNNAHCNTHQSDTMLAVKMADSDEWQEYLGAQGYSGSRNPAYTDGDAGDFPSIAVDKNSNVHLAYQFFWEGCDSNNALHPDAYYIEKPFGAYGTYTEADEQQVEGNDYVVSNYQNAVGYHNSLVLDQDGSPVVFYGANEVNNREHGLRVARKVNGVWQSEWVDKGCYIGDVSAAVSPEGILSVAYYITDCTEHLSFTQDDSYALRYAEFYSKPLQESVEEEEEATDGTVDQDASEQMPLSDPEWHIQIVDEATKVGSYTQLKFDNDGRPGIVYYETESYGTGNQRELYNLKLATFETDNNRWFKQRVAEEGDIGKYNSLWFDEENKINIVTYSKTDNTIYLFTENE